MKRILFLFSVLLALGSCTGRAARTDSGSSADIAVDASATASAVEHFAGTDITPDKTLPVIIDFNADWCPPCRMFAPVFDEVAESMKGKARFVSVNVDNSGDVARKFGVTAIPQVTVLKTDGTTLSTTGYMDRQAFEAFLATALR